MSELDLLRETLVDYEKLRGAPGVDLPKLVLVAVQRERCIAPMNEELFDEVKQALEKNGTCGGGWARFRSELGRAGCPPPCYGKSGPPIAAEWLDCEGVAYRLTLAPDEVGKALIVSVKERRLGPSDSLEENGEIPALRERVEVMAAERATPFTHLAYRIYWGLPANGSQSATRRLFDCFAGFLERS